MSKIRSCESCRKSKLRCEPGDDGSFPCKRCQRHSLSCADPRLTAPVGEEDPAIALISKVVRKQAKQPNVQHIRARAFMFMRSLGLLYKYGHRSRLLDVLRSLAKTTDVNLQDFLEKLPFPAETDAGPFRYTMRSEDCVHPYVGAFFAEGNASIVLVMMGGQARVICSEMWERVFFTQEEANRRFLLGHELLLENMMSLVHPDECRRLSETLEYTMFKADSPTSEVSQIFKVRVPSCGAYIMALVRLRNVILYDGNYLCAGYSVLPLPLPTATSGKKCIKAEKRPLAFCPNSMDLFQATVQAFGEPDPALSSPNGGPSAIPMISFMDHDPSSECALNPQLQPAGFPVYTPNEVGFMQIPYDFYMTGQVPIPPPQHGPGYFEQQLAGGVSPPHHPAVLHHQSDGSSTASSTGSTSYEYQHHQTDQQTTTTTTTTATSTSTSVGSATPPPDPPLLEKSDSSLLMHLEGLQQMLVSNSGSKLEDHLVGVDVGVGQQPPQQQQQAERAGAEGAAANARAWEAALQQQQQQAAAAAAAAQYQQYHHHQQQAQQAPPLPQQQHYQLQPQQQYQQQHYQLHHHGMPTDQQAIYRTTTTTTGAYAPPPPPPAVVGAVQKE